MLWGSLRFYLDLYLYLYDLVTLFASTKNLNLRVAPSPPYLLSDVEVGPVFHIETEEEISVDTFAD